MDVDLDDIRRIRQKDADGYARLLNRHRSGVFHLALRLTADHHLAEEVAQDAFVKAFNSLKDFRGESRFSTWLYRITWTTALSCLRREKRSRAHVHYQDQEGWEMAAEDPDALAQMLSRDRGKQLEKAMLQLSESERLALSLFYLKEHSLAEIAEITEESAGTVKVRIFRARKRLAEIIKKQWPEEWEMNQIKA